MKILFIADGRSPTTLSWIGHWIREGDTVHLISSYSCELPSGLASYHTITVAFNRLAGSGQMGANKKVLKRWREPLRYIRYYLGPLSLKTNRRRYLELLDKIRPDLVHALRIPFEGMLATVTPRGTPLILSIWGNDLTLHAHGSALMARMTRQALRRADALFADTRRDIRLGEKWGFNSTYPTLVVPGTGGIFSGEEKNVNPGAHLPGEVPSGPVILNPRGQRPGSLRQDVFFRAIPHVLRECSEATFICPQMKDDPQAERMVASLGIGERTWLWKAITQKQLWSLMRRAQIYVSPSVHDGTPNSFLEALYFGCFPITGNIESMREWIQDGVNGFLIDARDERSLARAILRGIKEPDLREKAARINAALIAERADLRRNMVRVREVYERLVEKV